MKNRTRSDLFEAGEKFFHSLWNSHEASSLENYYIRLYIWQRWLSECSNRSLITTRQILMSLDRAYNQALKVDCENNAFS